MVSGSLSLISSSFPSYIDSSPNSVSFWPITFKLFKPNPRFSKSLKYPSSKLSCCSSTVEDGSSSSTTAEQFFNNNSIADFMRFKRGSQNGSGELQTAIVSYRKRFPWSILYPFLRVDLVSTIHIADKENADRFGTRNGNRNTNRYLYDTLFDRG
ncbi:hypothetical protein ES319_A07G007500v1 [Gossypium barbadense]|uniref:Uncharacterized protein n=1 Tax=Gossypium barbadense TaxID=3634 RepID=A0A5J5UXY1_GOSBA|nr:hypothetical protein ES319_A07G007500v1 [Gossypium barbadense]